MSKRKFVWLVIVLFSQVILLGACTNTSSILTPTPSEMAGVGATVRTAAATAHLASTPTATSTLKTVITQTPSPTLTPLPESSPTPLAFVPIEPIPPPEANLILYVSNQSFAISPVDIQISIDGKPVVRQHFDVENQHTWQIFEFSFGLGKHQLSATSSKGEATITQTFEVVGKHWAVLDYWYYPESHYSPTPRHFTFHIQNTPVYFE